MTLSAEPALVPDRSCGSCNVCCVSLTIDDPALQKAQGHRCRNAQPDNSCAIYDTRPGSCRTFYCGWRLLKWVRGTLRPDRSGVLVRLQPERAAPRNAPRLGVVFTLLNPVALAAEGLAESVGAAVAAGVPTYINVPGPPGYTSGQARINEALADAVRTKNKDQILQILYGAYEEGRSGAHTPIILMQPGKKGARR